MSGQWRCPTCGFELYHPIGSGTLSTSEPGLYNDARFPGRCILALRTHEEHLESLDDSRLGSFWRDAITLGSAVKAVTGAARVNYAVMGNAQAHLHIHVIPRQSDEPLPTRPPWNDPRPLEELPRDKMAELAEHLSRLLS